MCASRWHPGTDRLAAGHSAVASWQCGHRAQHGFQAAGAHLSTAPDQLEKASRGSLDINPWLDYFADTIIKAQEIAREEVNFVLAKTRFYEVYGNQLNDPQARMVSRVFAEGRKGFEVGITTKKYETIAKCPNRTASRDLSDLVAKGIITPLPGGGRTTRYELTIVEPAQSGLMRK